MFIYFAHGVNWNGGCRFGTIISTKAILDKNTNKCKGYGFVDFESPSAAESAVKALQLQGIQAQMAKVIVKVITPLSLFYSSVFTFYEDCHFIMVVLTFLCLFPATRARSDKFVPGQLTSPHHGARPARHALQVRHRHFDPSAKGRRKPKSRRRFCQVRFTLYLLPWYWLADEPGDYTNSCKDLTRGCISF